MGAILLKCPVCGRVYSVERMSEKDGHQCICGQMLDKWTNYIGFCENVDTPNKPLGVWKRSSTERPSFPSHTENAPIWHGDNSTEMITPKKVKKITIDVEAGKGFDELLKNVKVLKESLEDIRGLVMIDNNGKVNVVPIISIDSKMMVFKTVVPYRKEDREALAKEYTNKLGIKCEIIDAETELVAVIDG